MSHLPNKLENKSQYIVGSKQTVYAGQMVKMVSNGVSAINLTSDELSVTDITEQSLEKVLCVIPLSLTKNIVIYQNLTTQVGYAIIHNIASGIITPVTALSLTDAIYSAQGYKISASKVCILVNLLSSQKIIVLNIDGSDNVTIGSSTVVSTNYVNMFEKINATKFLYGGYHNDGTFTQEYDLVVGVIAGDDSLTFTTTPIQTFASPNELQYDTVKCGVLSETKVNLFHQNTGDDVRSTIVTINNDNTCTVNNTIIIENEYDQPLFRYRKSPTLIDAKALDSTKCVVITTYKESTQTDWNFSKFNTTIRIVTETPTILGSLVVSNTEEQQDLKVIALTDKKIITQRHTQKPTNATIYNLDLSGNITKSIEISLTEIYAISNKAWEKVDYNQIIEYTLQASNKTSVKIVRTTQDVPQNILGFAVQNGVAGEKIFVSNGKEISGFSGLIQGSIYYLSDAGLLTTIPEQTPNKIGVAINSNKIKRLF